MQAVAAPQVAVSIKPLQLIAAAITEGVSTPVTVWAQGQDPHHVALRPSERRLLAGADLVLWTGPMLEQPLAALVDDLDAEVLTVQDLRGLVLIDVDGQPDPHVWVDTRNARLIAAALAEALAGLDPLNAAQYRMNVAGFTATLDTLDAELIERLAGAQQREWAVYHHALRYLEREFNLLSPLTLADSENNAPGVRTAIQVREQLQQKQITCMLAEPGVNHEEVLTMLDLPTLRVVDADVMGRGADAGDYASYVRTLVATVSECLGVAP
jgi:zinc transport system substrate-binding protein